MTKYNCTDVFKNFNQLILSYTKFGKNLGISNFQRFALELMDCVLLSSIYNDVAWFVEQGKVEPIEIDVFENLTQLKNLRFDIMKSDTIFLSNIKINYIIMDENYLETSDLNQIFYYYEDVEQQSITLKELSEYQIYAYFVD